MIVVVTVTRLSILIVYLRTTPLLPSVVPKANIQRLESSVRVRTVAPWHGAVHFHPIMLGDPYNRPVPGPLQQSYQHGYLFQPLSSH
jgi:hypothetical protein